MFSMQLLALFLLGVGAVTAAAEGQSSVGAIPTVTIAPGVELPMAGLGTWLYNNTVAEAAAAEALALGYVHIDTANDYDNQLGVGRAIKASGRARKSFFLTSKVPGGLNASETTAAHAQNLQDLGLAYVDLLLVHYPTTMSATPVGSKAMRQDQWKAMEALVRAGKTRAIGVSHFCESQMQDILEMAAIKPAVNQVQYHVGMGPQGPKANDNKAFDRAEGILFQSFSPLCGPCTLGNSTEPDRSLINGPLVSAIGKSHGKSGAQVSLKWLVQQGIPVIPKTDTKKHLLQNMDLFTWQLTAAEMKQLNAAATPGVAGAAPGDSGDCGLP